MGVQDATKANSLHQTTSLLLLPMSTEVLSVLHWKVKIFCQQI